MKNNGVKPNNIKGVEVSDDFFLKVSLTDETDNSKVSEIMRNLIDRETLSNITVSLMSKNSDENYVWFRFSSLNFNMFHDDSVTHGFKIRVDTDQDLIGHLQTENCGHVIVYYDVYDCASSLEVITEKCPEQLIRNFTNFYDDFPDFVQSRYNHFLDQAKSNSFVS